MTEESVLAETSETFRRMWNRRGLRAEIRAANAIAIRVWQVELSYPLSVLWFIVMPFIWFIPLLIAGTAVAGGPESSYLESLVGTRDWISFVAVGTAITGLTISMMWGTGMSLRREQNTGTLETLMTTPMHTHTLVWGSMLHNLQHGGLGVILQMGAAVVFFGVTINAWGVLPALGIIALAIIGLQGVVFAITCIVLFAKQGWMIVEFISSTLLLVAPLSYPIAVLPPILQYVSQASPLTWSVEGFRGFLLDGLAYAGVVQVVTSLLVLDIIFIFLGAMMYRYTERYVRKRGAWDQF
ncbi:MAG: ABC transporter permease [Candidatus Thorarchaeota archaeon]|nr:ABC transporter permease [Candidatus Thorarchaeota archaeon]